MLGRRLFMLFLVFGCCFEHFYTVRSTQYANILQKKKENIYRGCQYYCHISVERRYGLSKMTIGLSANTGDILSLSLNTSIIVSCHVTINDAIKDSYTVRNNNI